MLEDLLVYTHLSSMNQFLELSKFLKVDISIEVGAYDGDFSKSASALNLRSFAFEASPHVFNRFKDQMTNIKYENLAVTDHCGFITFVLNSSKDPEWAPNNSIKSRKGISSQHLRIPCTSLDSYFSFLDKQKVALWIDCEGANQEVLSGATKLLQKNVCSIYIEVEKRQIWSNSWVEADVNDYLLELGFKKFRKFREGNGQANIIYVKNEIFGIKSWMRVLFRLAFVRLRRRIKKSHSGL